MDHPSSKTPINCYKTAHAAAYTILNRVEKKLRRTNAEQLMAFVRWEWIAIPDHMTHAFRVRIYDQWITTQAPDGGAMQMDFIADEWYDEVAKEIVAWMLLMADTKATA